MGRGKQRRKYKQKQKRIEKAKSGKPNSDNDIQLMVYSIRE